MLGCSSLGTLCPKLVDGDTLPSTVLCPFPLIPIAEHKNSHYLPNRVGSGIGMARGHYGRLHGCRIRSCVNSIGTESREETRLQNEIDSKCTVGTAMEAAAPVHRNARRATSSRGRTAGVGNRIVRT